MIIATNQETDNLISAVRHQYDLKERKKLVWPRKPFVDFRVEYLTLCGFKCRSGYMHGKLGSGSKIHQLWIDGATDSTGKLHVFNVFPRCGHRTANHGGRLALELFSEAFITCKKCAQAVDQYRKFESGLRP